MPHGPIPHWDKQQIAHQCEKNERNKYPQPAEQFYPHLQSQPSLVRIEIRLNNAIDRVSPQKLKKSEVALTHTRWSWFGLLVSSTLMFALDSISLIKSKQTAELHWSSLILTSALTSTCMLTLALHSRQTLSSRMVLTIANVTWFTISLAIFYNNSLGWKDFILSIAKRWNIMKA